MKKSEMINEGGINGLGVGVVNTNAKEFIELQRTIIERSKNQTKSKILENKLLSLRFRMESYLGDLDPEIVEVGWFLREYLKELGIRNKVFAEYIGFQESNLSALFRGNRKINIDLALKLGQIFRVNPNIWIHIQSKNELLRMQKENKLEYQKYDLADLIKKAS